MLKRDMAAVKSQKILWKSCVFIPSSTALVQKKALSYKFNFAYHGFLVKSEEPKVLRSMIPNPLPTCPLESGMVSRLCAVFSAQCRLAHFLQVQYGTVSLYLLAFRCL